MVISAHMAILEVFLMFLLYSLECVNSINKYMERGSTSPDKLVKVNTKDED